MLNLAIGVFFGLCFGVLCSLALGSHLIRKAKEKQKQKLKEFLGDEPKAADSEPVKNDDLKKEREAYAKVKPRLDRAAEITREQAELMAQIDMPSKNSLHSKFKNGLVAEARKLEEEKSELLRSIIADGFDPQITVQLEGEGLRQMKLSEYLTHQGYDVKPATKTDSEPAPGESKEEPSVRKVGNFFVIKGGKPETNN